MMNNAQRKEIKKYTIAVIEGNTNNVVLAVRVISDEEIECTCKNRFSEEHIITLIIGAKANYIMYDGGVIKVDYGKM